MALPAGFGVARFQDTGTSSNELLYEHHYRTAPVRHYSATEPPDAECGGALRPAMRGARLAFRFFGNRVPETADHGRCWMGHLLAEEVRLGRLASFEFLVSSRQAVTSLLSASSGPLPRWTWSVRTVHDDRVAALVTMAFCPHDSVTVRINADDAALCGRVFRVLRQYCDNYSPLYESRGWYPVPEAPKVLSKVAAGQPPEDDRRLRVGGRHRDAATSGSATAVALGCGPGVFAQQYLSECIGVNVRIVQALSRGMLASQAETSVYGHIVCVQDVANAFVEARQARVAISKEWSRTAGRIAEALLRRIIQTQDVEERTSRLEQARALARRFEHDFDAPRAPSIVEAERLLEQLCGGPPAEARGEALELLKKVTAVAGH